VKATDKKPLMIRLSPEMHRQFKTACAAGGTSAQQILELVIARLVLDPPFIRTVLDGPKKKGARPK